MKNFKKEAEEKFKLIKKDRNKVYIIHYSCESFIKHQDKTPRIASIAIRNYGSNQTISFSINKVAEVNKVELKDIENRYNELEKEMLDEYFQFIKDHRDYYYVNWNMRDTNYGFPAIQHRYKVLNGSSIVHLDESRLLDLSKLLIDYYGVDYIDNPRLSKLMEKNNISGNSFLTGEEEAECFDNKEYIKLNRSTLKKVDIIYNILNRQINGVLKTDNNKFKQFVDNIFESSVCKIISILAAIWTIFSIPLLFK